MEAIRFLHYQLGFDFSELIRSAVLDGWGKEQLQRLGFRKQSPILPLAILQQFESWMVEDSLPLNELLVVGGVLLLVACRCRFSDLDTAQTVERVAGQIMISVSETKTSGSIGDRLPLYICAPDFLTTNCDWFGKWIEVREKLCITFPIYPMYPARKGSEYLRAHGSLQAFNAALRTFTHL